MYFYFSPFIHFTYGGGPDMNLNFYGDQLPTTCVSGSAEYQPDQTYASCLFATFFTSSFNVTNSVPYFANPNIGFLTNYWNDNVITVGFAQGTSSSVAGNYVEFYADNTGATCDPTELNHQALVAQFVCVNSTSPVEGDGYEVRKLFGTPYSQGTFLIHVRAQFANGESINQCQTLTLNQTLPTYDRAQIMIRGDISDFSNSPINYSIEIYEAN
jgi:hypothetical protein